MARGRDQASAAPVGRASASPSPMRQAGTAKQAAELGRAEDVRGLFDDIAAARPSAVAEAGLGALQRSIPGCARAEEAAALAVEGARYGAALARLAACDRAARTLLSGWRARHARRILAAAKHARAAGVATKLYLEERGGAAVRRAWAADMEAFEKEQAAARAAWYEDAAQREGELRLANTLRHGWRAVAVRVADLGGLKVDADDALDETAEVEAFERARPPKPRVRGKRTLDARFRDADQARYRDAPRVLVAAEDRGDAWAKTERERLRVAPRYAADDDAAALHWQTYYRAHRARGRVAAARKDRARRAREQREKEEWALTQQERSRYVSVRCGLEVFEPDLLAGRAAPAAPAAAAKAPDDADEADAAKGPFEGDECPIVEDLHVVARFGAVGEHWYAGTVQDATRAAEGVFTVAFDDGDVDDAVRREDIRVPRLAGGDRVEALYGATDHYYPATVVGVNSRDGVYRLKFDDGDVLPRAPRTSLRVLDADDRVAAQARRDARARVEAEAARRGALRAAAQQAARADDLAALAGLRRRFERARAVDGKDAVAAAFRATAARTRAPDPHAPAGAEERVPAGAAETRARSAQAAALADVAAAARDALRMTRPRYVVKLRIEYTRVALRYGWTEREDESGRAFFVSGRTTWERPAFDFEEDGAARRLVRAYRAYVERRELARDLGSDHLPALIADVREAACLVCPWWPRGDPLRDADASPPLELWLARRGFSRDAVARAARVAARRARRETDATRHLARTDAERARADRAALREARAEVLAAIRAVEAASRARDAALAEAKQAHDWRRRRGEPVGDDLEAATKAHADETAAEDAELERLGLRDAADRRWLRRYDDARAKPLAYWTSARDDRPLADALRAQGPAAYGAPLLAAYRNQKNRCAAMAAALAASRFPVTGCMVDRLLADFPSKPAAAQDAVAARLVDVPTTAVAADERAALAALAAGARRVRDLVAESGATELAERLDATYRAACAVEQPLDDAAATGSAGATVLALRRQALAEADAAAAAARGGEASGAAARACWLIDDGVLELALRAWRATTRLQTGARRASALRQHARRKAARAAAGALVRRGWRCVLARRLATLMRAQQRAPWHMLHDDASGAFYFQHVESGEVSWEAPEGGEAAYRPQVVDRFSGRWVLAWPQLERPKPLALQQPREGYCMACKLEPATRRCDTCAAPRFELVPPSWGDGYFHFCFACFYTHHDRSPAMKAHKAVLTRALTAPPLTCCVCAEPATRRCRGLVLPPRGRFILQRFLLQHAVAGDAVRVDDDDDAGGGGADGADAEAAAAPGESEAARGERRRAREKREFDAAGAAARAALARENEELAAEAGKPAPEAADPRTLTAAKLRTALRGAGVPLSLARARALHARAAAAMGPPPPPGPDDADAEAAAAAAAPRRLAAYHGALVAALAEDAAKCADDYCADCWAATHARGARARHAWTGYAANASVCALCEADVARRRCDECGDDLCVACSLRIHARGKRARHAVVALREPLSDFQLNALNASHCQACDYAVADPAHGCTLCGARLCESCLLFDHDAVCAKRGGARAASMGLDPDLPTKCAVCGRRPEIRCAQCGEVYCLWMGQPRCFRQRHVKGKRADHEYVPYTLLEGLERRVAAEDAAEADRVAARRAEQQRAAAEFLAECERQEAADREHAALVDAAAEELLREQLRLERESRRGRHLRAFWRGLVSLLPGPLRRSLSPPPRRDYRRDRLRADEFRARKERGEVGDGRGI